MRLTGNYDNYYVFTTSSVNIATTTGIATIVTSWTYLRTTVGQSTVTLVDCLVPSIRPIYHDSFQAYQ